MNDRQRFQATMHYQPRDRSPIYDFGFWQETLVIWEEQGLPRGLDKYSANKLFGMDNGLDAIDNATRVVDGLYPPFDEHVIEDRGDHVVMQNDEGVHVLRRKFMSSIPQPLRYTLTDRESWEQHYKPRLDPSNPGRYPADWEARADLWRDSERENAIALRGGSLYGWLRNWMGMENLSLVVYDDPAWFEEMVTTVADCILGTMQRVLETGGVFDGCSMWEDMCYSAGPLLSPKHFKRYLVPHYRRIADLLHIYDVDLLWIDCDGKIDHLIPLWLDAGVNCMFPLEVGTWGADPLALRKEYGKDLLMMGGFDKHILARTPEEIEQEVHRLMPLVEEGGFIGFCDHRVPPDVPLENYLFYLDKVREIWGYEVNLKPMGLSLKTLTAEDREYESQ